MNLSIGYFHGRFQPFHNGHLAVVKSALEQCDLLVIGITNPFRLPPVHYQSYTEEAKKSVEHARQPENNPWPYWARALMIREGLKSEGIDLTRVLLIPNLNNTGLPVDEVRFPKEITTIFVSPKEEHNHAITKKYEDEGWRVSQITPKHASISATEVRAKIRKNEPWEHLVPKGTAKVIKELEKLQGEKR